MPKKKFIIVGNKQNPLEEYPNLPVDLYSDAIDSFDYVLRVNRMNNYGITGTKIDGIYIGFWYDYVVKFNGGEYKDKLCEVKDVYMLKHNYDGFKKYWYDFFNEKQMENIKILDFKEIGTYERVNIYYPCSTIAMIDYFSNNEKIINEYEVYFTGIDVKNRGKVLMEGEPWKDTAHRFQGGIEKDYIINMMNLGKIKNLEDEIISKRLS